MRPEHSKILQGYLDELRQAASLGPILDLACGTGRNGLFLIENDIATVFADQNTTSLELLKKRLPGPAHGKSAVPARLWEVDFEREDDKPLREKSFGGIMVFRYLHRPLMQDIRKAILPGGIIIYETFTVEQVRFGRPRNPDYLLQAGELENYFPGWKILHRFEGIIGEEAGGNAQAISRIVAIKPDNKEQDDETTI